LRPQRVGSPPTSGTIPPPDETRSRRDSGPPSKRIPSPEIAKLRSDKRRSTTDNESVEKACSDDMPAYSMPSEDYSDRHTDWIPDSVSEIEYTLDYTSSNSHSESALKNTVPSKRSSDRQINTWFSHSDDAETLTQEMTELVKLNFNVDIPYVASLTYGPL